MIRTYIKLATRSLLKYKTQNAISIVGLAAGIFCFTICLYITRFSADADKCFDNHERITVLSLYGPYGEISGTPFDLAPALRNCGFDEVEAVSTVSFNNNYTFNSFTEKGEILSYDLCCLETDTSYNKVFTPELIAGSWEKVSAGQNSLVLSRSVAERMYGKIEDAVGKKLLSTERRITSPASTPATGGITYTVQAVMEDIPLNNTFSFLEPIDMLMVNDSEGAVYHPRANMTGCNTYVLLAPSVTNGQFQQILRQRLPSHHIFGEENEVRSQYMTEKKHKGIPIVCLVVGIVGTMVLVVSFLNFFQFLIGSFLNRMKDYSLMKLLGIGRKRLFMQLFTECLMIILIAGFILFWLYEVFGNRLSFSIPPIMMTFSRGALQIHSLQYLFFIIVLCAVVCAFVMWRISRISIQNGIYGSNKRNGKKRMRNVMLGVQLFICWIFTGLTIGIYLQTSKISDSLFSSLSRKEKEEILSVPLNYNQLSFPERMVLVEKFKQLSGVKDIMPADNNLVSNSSGRYKAYIDAEKQTWIDAQLLFVPENFFGFMDMDILEGQGFRNAQEVVVDPIFKSKRYREELLGMTLYILDDVYRVCGVSEPYVKEVYNRYSSVGYVYLPHNFNEDVAYCYIKCYPGRADEVRAAVESICGEMLPSNLNPEVNTLMEDINTEQRFELAIVKVVLFFAIICIIITLLGVYSSITLDTELRRKEVAVRKVFGAGEPQIMMLFGKLYISLLVFSALVAFPILWIVMSFFKGEYSVFFDNGFLFWAGLFAAVAALVFVTIVFRILYIARQNPAEVLKRD